VEIPPSEVVKKKNNKYDMSKTFFIFFSIPNDLFFGESNIYHYLGDFTSIRKVVEGICTRIDGCKVVSGTSDLFSCKSMGMMHLNID